MKTSPRLYFRGQFPCGHCNLGRHNQCRPRLDGTLCTCKCPRADLARGEYLRKSEAAAAAGLPEPSVAMALEILHPRYHQEFPTGI